MTTSSTDRSALTSAHDAANFVCESFDELFAEATLPAERWQVLVERGVAQYGIAFLLLVLHRVDPGRADWAASELLNVWEAGDSLGEWAYEWRERLAAGELPNLPGDVNGNWTPLDGTS